MEELILILDFGGQYNQLIARRVRECGVYCEVWPYTTDIKKIKAAKPKGIILTGGPNSVYEENAPSFDDALFSLGAPILGICYGFQLIVHKLSGKVTKSDSREYGQTRVSLLEHPLFTDIERENQCWMSHTDFISKLPEGFTSIASSSACPIAAYENEDREIYGVQFHPEVEHTPFGTQLINNFLTNICKCSRNWRMKSFAEAYIAKIREKIGNKIALCALSGGVDSTVAAALINKAIGRKLICVFVDHGLMRKGEGDEVERVFKNQFDLNLIRINCEDRFLTALSGITDPESKRRIIGEEFIRVFEEYARSIGHVDFLIQGTIYPDIIESGLGDAAVIKSHHNVGGLPDVIDFEEIIEPLKHLFKDEVRALGRELGVPDALVNRQPFPGPGLGVRVIGELSREKLNILRDADAIFREELEEARLSQNINQFFAVLTGIKSVGVMGDARTYDYTIALRAVTTNDFMTADWADIPYDVLRRVSGRIVNEVKRVNRVVYDITSKPPATIEWE